jgi:hypothetical protein
LRRRVKTLDEVVGKFALYINDKFYADAVAMYREVEGKSWETKREFINKKVLAMWWLFTHRN